MTTLALCLRYWREGALAAALLFGVLMCHARDRALLQQGAAEANALAIQGALHVSDSTLVVRDADVRHAAAAQHVAEAQRDSAAAHATAAIARWQTLAAQFSVATAHDVAAVVHDTASALPSLPVVLQAGNALAARCSQVITDCDAERAGAHATIAALTADRDAWKERSALLERATPPPPRSCTSAFTLGAVLGAAGGLVAGENLRIPLLTLHR